MWVMTENSRAMPLDPKPNDAGNVIILAGRRSASRYGDVPVVRVFPNAEPTLGEEDVSADGRRYMSHFATCTRPQDHRRRR